MAPLSESAFQSLLGGLTPEAFEAFVASLWRERGLTVSREDAGEVRVLTVIDPDTGQTRRLLVQHDAPRLRRARTPSSVADADVVVRSSTSRSGVGDVRLVDATDLYRISLYAIDRDACDDLFETFFDRSLTSVAGDRSAVGRLSRRRVAFSGVFLLVVATVAVGAVGMTVLDDASVQSGSSSESFDEAPAPTPMPGGAAATPDGDSAHTPVLWPASKPAGASFPPGLERTGITNASALASAHVRHLSGREYRLVITRRESTDGRPTAVDREVARVEGLTRYRSTVTTSGNATHESRFIADADIYANGSVRFERVHDGTERYRAHPLGPRIGRDPYLTRVEMYLEWFLAAETSRLVDTFERDGTTYYWLTLYGDPWRGAQNATGSVLVDSSGLVHELHHEHSPTDAPAVTVSITLRFTDVGHVETTPPPWYGRAQNATQPTLTPMVEGWGAGGKD